MTLTEFLLARIAEVESVALACGNGWTGPEAMGAVEGADSVLMSPTHVLAECEAKRRIVEMATRQAAMCPPDDWPSEGDMSAAPVADSARWFLRALAQPHVDHPDCDESWRA